MAKEQQEQIRIVQETVAGKEITFAHVEIGFMDRFCGSLILTGGLGQVETAVDERGRM